MSTGAAGTGTRPAGRRPGHGRGRIQVGTAITLGNASADRLVLLAAAAAEPDSTDPVDIALRAEAAVQPGVGDLPTFEAIDPATADRPYSITVVTEADGKRRVIVRGELGAIMSFARIGPDKRLLLRNNERWVGRRGYRPLAVATAETAADDTPRNVEVLGFVPIRTSLALGFRGDVVSGDAEWTRVPLWPATLRWVHWLNVLAILVLTLSGYLIATPYLHPGNPDDPSAGFFMGWVRYVHFVSGFAWLMIAAVRIYLFFFSRNRFVRWPALWPLKNKGDLRELGHAISAYALIRPQEVPTYVAHNPLQQLAYSGIYVMALVQAWTGLALYGLYDSHGPFWSLFQLPVTLFGAAGVRLIHFLIMWAFWAFLILHIYLAVRADTIERHGGLSSMISGGIWLRRGTHPADDPDLRE